MVAHRTTSVNQTGHVRIGHVRAPSAPFAILGAVCGRPWRLGLCHQHGPPGGAPRWLTLAPALTAAAQFVGGPAGWSFVTNMDRLVVQPCTIYGLAAVDTYLLMASGVPTGDCNLVRMVSIDAAVLGVPPAPAAPPGGCVAMPRPFVHRLLSPWCALVATGACEGRPAGGQVPRCRLRPPRRHVRPSARRLGPGRAVETKARKAVPC